jgi:hypothetical protein
MDMQTTAVPVAGEAPSLIDRAIAILRHTRDGNDLSPSDLGLVELMVNASAFGVSEEAEAVFESLYQRVIDGRYDASSQYLHGVEHLTRDHQGYILWRGRRIEHYSYRNRDDERIAAEKLGARCRSLEARDIPVTGRSAIMPIYETMPAGSAHLPLIERLYAAFADENGLPACVIVSLPDGSARALAYQGDTLTARDFEGCYEAFHGCGYRRSLTNLLDDYGATANMLEAGRFTPEAVAAFLH